MERDNPLPLFINELATANSRPGRRHIAQIYGAAAIEVCAIFHIDFCQLLWYNIIVIKRKEHQTN